ncbi:MAG: hypothetical protein ACXVLQ_02755 [Bacteriovorax sp.]
MKNRNGSYKKILLETQVLKDHGDYLRENLAALKKSHLSPFDFTALYLLLFLRIKHKTNWLQPVKNEEKTFKGIALLEAIPESFLLTDWEKEKLKGITSYDLFACFSLKAIPKSINKTMLRWHEGLWKIEMLEYVPTSRELLKLQVKNTRCITLITDPKKIDELVFGTRDPLSFVLHDLMHADQFFSQVDSLKGQLGFYGLINSVYDRPLLRSLLKSDAHFKREFEYVASDMNAYVIHLFKCLKSSIYRTKVNEEFFHLLLCWWNMTEDEKISAHNLNTPHFSYEDELILKTFFENNQEILA